MEGSGVTNYAVDKPTFAWSTSTTEFDDALLKRNIVTQHQVMLAKGASDQEANRLTQLKENGNNNNNNNNNEENHDSCRSDDSSSSSFNDNDDDDTVLQRYRQQRTAQWQSSFSTTVLYIQRSEWNRHVNEASHAKWVVVCLTSSDTERTGCMERAVQELAELGRMHHPVQFVLIPYHQAIDHPHWSVEHLPCLFLYRHGVVQKQLMRLAHITAETLYELLHSHMA